MSLQKLRNVAVDRIDVDDAIELVTLGRAAASTYTAYQVPTPQWLTDGISTLDAEIKRRRRDMLESRAKEIDANLATLKTREEKRAELEAERAKLRDALGA